MKVKVDSKSPVKGKTNWDKLRNASDEEIELAARSDPDNPPLTAEELKKMRRVAFVKHIRFQLGLSQAQFARTFQLSLATLRDWEQHRYQPDQPARTLIKLIALIPDAVMKALASKASERLNRLLSRK